MNTTTAAAAAAAAAKGVFKSHLMQQFVTSARKQNKPPLALMGWLLQPPSSSMSSSSSPATPPYNTAPQAPGTANIAGTSAAAADRRQSSDRDVLGSGSGGVGGVGMDLSSIDTTVRGTSRDDDNDDIIGYLSSSSPRRRLEGRYAMTMDGVAVSSSSPSSGILVATAYSEQQRRRRQQHHQQQQQQQRIRAQSTGSAAAVAESIDDDDIDDVNQEKKRAGGGGGEDEEEEEQKSRRDAKDGEETDELALRFQGMIQTRRTGSEFVARDAAAASPDYWTDATDRAVICARHAPNHKRTEPFTFLRFFSPGETSDKLADIAYHVQYRKRILKKRNEAAARTRRGRGSPSEVESTATNEIDPASYSPSPEEEEAARQSAEKKRRKWKQIPAFLVAIVSSRPRRGEMITTTRRDDDDDDNNGSSGEESDVDGGYRHDHQGGGRGGMYDPLPFRPPNNVREMEDYASACAAVQNALLSLHSERISSKWATGPVVETPAFRKLLRLRDPDDRVVALVMIGGDGGRNAAVAAADENDDDDKATPVADVRPRRFRRALHGDVLVDMV